MLVCHLHVVSFAGESMTGFGPFFNQVVHSPVFKLEEFFVYLAFQSFNKFVSSANVFSQSVESCLFTVGWFTSGSRFPTRSRCSYGCLSRVSLICNCLLPLQWSSASGGLQRLGHLSCLLSHLLNLSKDPGAS